MDFNKGKSITTSVPTMSIRFNATAEEIEEVYGSDEEQNDNVSGDVTLPVSGSGELKSSPRRIILPLLGKRSTSIDTNPGSAQDASPPSDPWRFLSDIKGKFTKNIEDKLTEYKGKNQDGDGSPKLPKTVKDSKESSSLSDSEEVSESSISKTCGIISTTEGVEMSSDDETPSLSEKDKPHNDSVRSPSSPSLRQRFRFTNKETVIKEGTVGMDFLDNVQKISAGLSGADSEIESGVDVLADLNISNFHLDDDNVLNVTQVNGNEVRFAAVDKKEVKTFFSPVGFVDLRTEEQYGTWFDIFYSLRHVIYALLGLMLYFTLPLTIYISGFITGATFMLIICFAYIKFFIPKPITTTNKSSVFKSLPIVNIPAVHEHSPLKKYEGWVNEYPADYNPQTYHISQTQSVYLKLQGNLLRISYGRQRIPKRAMWNEPEHKLVFTNHRIYNLLGAKVSLIPEGLAKVRHWSKKYPICIALKRDQLTFQYPAVAVPTISHKDAEKKEELEEAQIYSMLASELEDQIELVPDTYSDVMFLPEENMSLLQYTDSRTNMKLVDEEEEDDRCSKVYSSWHDITQDSPDTTYLYLFGRTGRQKEDWFRRLKYATNELPSSQSGETKGEVQYKDNRSSTALSAEENQLSKNLLEQEYLTYMNKMSDVISFCDDSTTNKRLFREDVKDVISVLPSEGDIKDHQWINTLIARVFFDALREPLLIQRIKDRIQRKLTSIRLPYFINELVCEELNLGNTSPYIGQSYRPIVDCRGLWVDLDVSYEGSVVVILQTKLDLLKLKQPRRSSEEHEKSAIFHSDVDDSAESTTDEDCSSKVTINRTSALDATGQPKHPIGGMSNKSKKFMKMVTGLTESKFFQAAAEMKYIKRAMEEVSNTDLRLKVEFKKCSGTLVLNIPPPPSDRIWFGFRFPPELILSAHPIVGERSISMHQVTRWIEKRIYKEFQKVLVMPNMEDIAIPVMSSKSLE